MIGRKVYLEKKQLHVKPKLEQSLKDFSTRKPSNLTVCSKVNRFGGYPLPHKEIWKALNLRSEIWLSWGFSMKLGLNLNDVATINCFLFYTVGTCAKLLLTWVVLFSYKSFNVHVAAITHFLSMNPLMTHRESRGSCMYLRLRMATQYSRLIGY